MKHISDNIKMNNLILVLKDRVQATSHNDDNNGYLEWISKHIIETLTTLGLSIVVAFFSVAIANIIGKDNDAVAILPIIIGLIIAAGVLVRHWKKSEKQITFIFNDGKLDEFDNENALSYLEKYIFPELVVAEECFETIEQTNQDDNCSGLNIVWGEISLRKSVNCLYRCAGSFKQDYDNDGVCGGLTKREIDQVFDVMDKVINKLERLDSVNFSERTVIDNDLRKTLDVASVRIRGDR